MINYKDFRTNIFAYATCGATFLYPNFCYSQFIVLNSRHQFRVLFLL